MKRTPTWLRVLIPALLIVGWLAAAGIGGPYFGRVDEVSSNEQSSFLPESAEATVVQNRLDDFQDSDSLPAVAIFSSDHDLSEADIDELQSRIADSTDIGGVRDEVSPGIISDDSRAVQAFIPLDPDGETSEIVTALDDELRSDLPEGIDVYITGPAGFSADLGEAFSGIDGLLLLVALGAVLVILVLVYRSFLLPIFVLATSMFALCAALLTVWWLAKWDILLLSGQTQGILFILVIGAATDYSLLYVARYREALRAHEDRGAATVAALKGTIEPVLASGSTVIAGLLCLLLSDLRSNSTLGPVTAIGIVFAMIAALTFLPSVLFACGRAAFWPRRPHYDAASVAAEDGIPTTGFWTGIAIFVRRHPRPIWIATGLLLVIGAAAVTQFKADGVAQSDLVLGESQARDGQEELSEHFAGGSGSPVYVLVPADELQYAAPILADTTGIASHSISISADDSVSGTVPIDRDGNLETRGPNAEATARIESGYVLVQATLTSAADSDEAAEVVRALRADLDKLPTRVYVGGVTAVSIDTNDAAIHDRNLIIPVVLAVILLILMALLRSILAPVLLILTTVLSFGTAIGVSAIVFNTIFDFPGADATVPLYGFVFLVALGIDYNIFLMTRVREESVRHGTRNGITRGLAITGGVITSAGVVLASTFAALSVIPILFLVQLAFIVAFGVLLDTFLVRSFLVPALADDIGQRIWWPSALSSREDDDDPAASDSHQRSADGSESPRRPRLLARRR